MKKSNLLGKIVVNVDYCMNPSCGRLYLVKEDVYPDQEGSENYVDLVDIEEMLIKTVHLEQFDCDSKQFEYFVIDGKYKERLLAALQGRPLDDWPHGR